MELAEDDIADPVESAFNGGRVVMDAATIPDGSIPAVGAGRHGRGELVFSKMNGGTVITRARANAPLRLLTPQNGSLPTAAWAFSSSFGGGLLAGDRIELDVEVEAEAVGYLGTQSSTKVYRSIDDRVSRQVVNARVGEAGFLALLPDPVVCFADARYEQKQRVDMAASGGLVMLDWFTSGRHGCGEKWSAAHFRTANEIWIDGTCVSRDVMQIDRYRGRVGMGLDVYNCLATLLIVGRRVEAQAKELLESVKEKPVEAGEMLPVAASPLAGGILMRVAGVNTEEVGRFLFSRLGFVAEFLGECPWSRKW